MAESLIESKIDVIVSMFEQNLWFVPALAFIAGLLTSLTPCSLASIPMVIGYVSGTKSNERKKAFTFSLLFAFGMALIYMSLGIFASLLGNIFHHLGIWWYVALGLITIIMALQMFEIINIFPESLCHTSSKRKGYTGAFIAGMLGGLFASHCALPVLIVLLAIAAEKSTALQGAFMLLLFALGHSVFVILAGTSTAFLEKMTKNRRYESALKVVKISIGIVMLALAAYLIFIGFSDPH